MSGGRDRILDAAIVLLMLHACLAVGLFLFQLFGGQFPRDSLPYALNSSGVLTVVLPTTAISARTATPDRLAFLRRVIWFMAGMLLAFALAIPVFFWNNSPHPWGQALPILVDGVLFAVIASRLAPEPQPSGADQAAR